MKKLTLSGGFHNSPETTIQVSDKDYEAYKSGSVALYEILSPAQDKRLRKHFCGIAGCTCGSYTRATITG
jgi:hypothetical protein